MKDYKVSGKLNHISVTFPSTIVNKDTHMVLNSNIYRKN
jgi:hypothetical protein